MENIKERKIVQVDWTQELQDELKKDIEKFNEDFNLEKLEQLIKYETQEDENFHNWLEQFIKESGHQWGFGFYVETIDDKIFHQGSDEYKEWYDDKLEDYKQTHNF